MTNMTPDGLRFPTVIRRSIPSRLDQHNGTWTLWHIVDATVRRRKTVAIVAVSTIAAAIAYVSSATPTYTSMSSVILDTKLTPPSPGTVSSDVLIDPAVVDSQVEILKSDKIALDVVDRLNLSTDTEFIGSESSFFRAAIGFVLTLFDPAPKGSVRSDPRQVAAGTLSQNVKVLRAGRSILAEIRATSLDPMKAAAIANAVAESYIQDQLNSRMEASQRSTDWMQRRLAEVRERVEAANAALVAIQTKRATGGTNDLVSAERAQRQGSLSGAAEALARAQVGLERMTQLRDAVSSGSFNPETLAQLKESKDEALSSLSAELNGSASDQRLLNRIAKRLDELADEHKRTVASSELRTALLDKQIKNLTDEKQADYNTQERALEQTARDEQSNFEVLQNRVTRVSAFLQQQSMPVTEARVVNTALPPLTKTAPKSSLILMLGMVGGLCAGVIAAFLRDTLDRRVRWPRQVTQELMQPFLGSLMACKARSPDFSYASATSQGRPQRLPIPLFIANGLGSPIALETLRNTKVSIDQALPGESCKTVGIVSANSGEGKTTLTTNLAVLLYEMRARVLVIDANFSGQSLANLVEGPSGPGLASAVINRIPIKDCIVPSRFGFDILPGAVGMVPDHPVEILEAVALRHMLAAVREHYDYILIEISPVLSSVDARVISDAIAGFVLVLCSGRTKRDDVEHTLAGCPAIADRLVGVVMNRAKLSERPAPVNPIPPHLQRAV